MSLKHRVSDSSGSNGLTCCIHHCLSHLGFAGTPGYLSPEVLRKDPYGKAVDLWACGKWDCSKYHCVLDEKKGRDHCDPATVFLIIFLPIIQNVVIKPHQINYLLYCIFFWRTDLCSLIISSNSGICLGPNGWLTALGAAMVINFQLGLELSQNYKWPSD